MNKILPVASLIFLLSCSGKPGSAADNKDHSSDSSVLEQSDIAIVDNEYELNYVVVVSEGYNYDSLRGIALGASQLLNFKFDTLERYFNPKRKKIVLPDDHEDEIWAGEYYFRRYGDSIVSIEMSSAYMDTVLNSNEKAKEKFYADTLKMFVFANMYPDRQQAESLAGILRRRYAKARIIPTEIFMGCMH